MCACDPVVVYSLSPLEFKIYQPTQDNVLNEFGLVDDRTQLTLVEHLNLDNNQYWPIDIGNFIIEEVCIPSYKILINFPKNYPYYHLNKYY